MKRVSIQFLFFKGYNTDMHEMEITQHILQDVLTTAQNYQAKRVTEITLALGPFCGFVPECIQMYMDVIAQDTMAKGVKIKVNEIPLKVLCNSCHKESQIDRKHIECPYCHSIDLKRLSGKECVIESIKVE